MLAVNMAVVMVVTGVVVRIVFQKVGVNVELGVEVKAAQVKHLAERYFAEMHSALRCARVHVGQAMHQRLHFVAIHQVGFADENLIGKADLPARFLALVELRGRVLGVHQREDGVQQVLLGDFLVHEKSLRHRAGVGQAGGLDHHALKIKQALTLFGGQQLQRFAQVFAYRAADAAIVHLDDVLVGVVHQNFVVDVFFTELVFNHGNFLSMRLCQHTLEQSGFAGTQKAGQDGDGNQTHGAPYKTKEELKTKTTSAEFSGRSLQRACGAGSTACAPAPGL